MSCEIYPKSICVSILYWCFSFWLTSLCIISFNFIHLIRTDSNVLFFKGWVTLHCVYVPQLSYLFICWWTSRLLPCPGYYKLCCDELIYSVPSHGGIKWKSFKIFKWMTLILIIFHCEKAFLLFSGVLTVADSKIPGILSQPEGSELKQSQLVSPPICQRTSS